MKRFVIFFTLCLCDICIFTLQYSFNKLNQFSKANSYKNKIKITQILCKMHHVCLWFCLW